MKERSEQTRTLAHRMRVDGYPAQVEGQTRWITIILNPCNET
jgi:hypothetical protein